MSTLLYSLGRFHSFDLARELFRLEKLDVFVTSYPKFKTKSWNLDGRVIHLGFIEFLNYGLKKLKLPTQYRLFVIHHLFQLVVTIILFILRPSHIIGFAGLVYLPNKCYRPFFNSAWWLERGSSHALTQLKLIEQAWSDQDGGCLALDRYARLLIKRELKEYRAVDKIVIPSEFSLKSFLDNGISSRKLIKINYGVNTKEFFNNISIQKRPKNVLYVGGASYRKGVGLLASAWLQREPYGLKEYSLMHCGGSDSKVPKAWSNNSEIVKYGHVPQKMLVTHYNESQVLVLPTYEDGFGMVLYQAAVCGLAIVVTKNSGSLDMLDQYNGIYLFEVGDSKGLLNAIQRATQDINRGKSFVYSGNLPTWESYGKRYALNLE